MTNCGLCNDEILGTIMVVRVDGEKKIVCFKCYNEVMIANDTGYDEAIKYVNDLRVKTVDVSQHIEENEVQKVEVGSGDEETLWMIIGKLDAVGDILRSVEESLDQMQ